MTLKSLLFAAALALPGGAVLAEAATPVGHGALAGRSPHQAYTRNADAPAACGKVMHTIPAGKLPTYGANALPSPGCANPVLARADAKSERARD